MLAVPVGQISQIFAVAGKPVNGREMSGIGQGFVQSPEAADETLGVLGNGLGEVTALWGNRADNGHGTFCAV